MDTNRTQDSSSDFDDQSFGAGTDNHDTDLEEVVADVGAGGEDIGYAPPDTEEEDEDETEQTFSQHIQQERELEQQRQTPIPSLDLQGESSEAPQADCPIDVGAMLADAIRRSETEDEPIPAQPEPESEQPPSQPQQEQEQQEQQEQQEEQPVAAVEPPTEPVSEATPVLPSTSTPPPAPVPVPTPVAEPVPTTTSPPAPTDSESVPQVKAMGAGLGLGGLPPRSGLGPKLPPKKPAAPAGQAPPPAAPSQQERDTVIGGLPPLPTRQPAPTVQARSGPTPVIPTVVAPAAAVMQEEDENESEDVRRIRRFVHGIRVLLIRSMKRISFPMTSNFARQVITRLDYIERLKAGQASGAAQARAQAEADRLEEQDPNGELDLEITILFIGQKGSGKTSTINSLLGRDPADVQSQSKDDIQVLEGVLNGVKLRCIDTPGLSPSASAIGQNQRKLVKIKAATKKYKPDAVLYVDRMDLMRRNMGDLPLLRQVSDTLGVSTLFNTLLVLTHANITPPEGRDGPLTYDTYLNQRAYMLQQMMRSATQDMRLINPVFAAENHPSARDEETGQLLLPTQKPWVNELMAGCITTKMLYLVDRELNLNSNDSSQQQTAFISRFLRGGAKIPPLPYLLSNMVQPKGPRKYPEEERDIRTMSEIKRMEGEAGKEALRKRREYLKIRADEVKQGEAQVAVPAPEPPLPPSFVADYPSHKYRYLERQTGWIARPMVEQAGLDHQDGVEGAHFEKQAVLRPRNQFLGGAPAYMLVQFKKSKGEMTAHVDAESSIYHTQNLVTTAGVQMQTVSEDMLYQVHVEPRFKIHPRDKISAGVVWARLGEDRKPGKGPVAVGMRVENRYRIKKGVKVIAAAGRMGCKTRFATEKGWAASTELRMKGGDRQQSEFSLGGSAMKFRRELALGMNVAAQHNLTRDTTGTARLSLNTKGTGSLAIRVTSHDQHKLAYSFLLPVVGWIVNAIRGQEALEAY